MRQMASKNTEKSPAELPTVLRKALHKGPPTCSSCHVAMHLMDGEWGGKCEETTLFGTFL